jgi:phosphohistidine phosphatase
MSTAEFTRKVPDLIVMRHSKSAYQPGIADHDRPLNDRGSRDSKAASQWFAQQRIPVDEAWVSSAVRAQQTWSGISDGVRESAVPGFDQRTVPGLYEASVDQLLTLLSEATASCLLVVAHNPGLEQLIERVTGRDAHGWLSHISQKYPTGAVCVIRHDGWAALARGDAELVAYAVPRAS